MSRWIVAVLYVPAYVAFDWISYVQPVLKLGITPWSPQTGLTVAFLFWAGPRWAPCTAVAAFLAELLVRDAPAGWIPHALASLWIAASYAGLVAMRPGGAGDVPLVLAAAVRFLMASVAAALVAAIGYVGCFLLTSTLPWDSALSSLARYWIGDVNGILMLAPLLLALPRRKEALRALEAGWSTAAVQALIIVVFVWLLFGIDDKLRFFYPLFVPMIWIAVRWGASGALLAALAIQVGIVVAMREPSFGAPLIDLQILILTLTVTGLLLGVAVTERARARSEAQERDRQLARAMRFAVAGEMASSLTHELNQPITALVSYLQAAQIMAAPSATAMADKRVAETLGKAANEAIRASEVLRRLRDFYQGTGPAAPGPTDVAACCASVLELLEPRLRRQGIRARLVLPQGLPLVAIDRTQVEMVLHNLLSNAADALVSRPPGSRELQLGARVEEGQVILAVEDSGPDVAADALGQLFEPFNTTKSDGMGLGLAISRNLMRAHGGELSHRPAALLGGACFELRLPRVQ